MEFRALANLNRLREIAAVFLRYGFRDLVTRLDLPGIPAGDRDDAADHPLTTAERVRGALQELGPTFIKLGQNLSLRPDLLPQSWILELAKLQDRVDPRPLSEVHGVLTASLGRPPEEVFSLIEETPLASASLSQVYRATLRSTGAVVVLKVQRPGIAATIEHDLDILDALAARLHTHYPDLDIYNLPRVLELTRRTLRRELDFRREARHLQIARANLAQFPFVCVPAPYPELSSRHLLVMEYVAGKKLGELTPGELAHPDELGRHGLHLSLRQVLDHGFFHADPHPGNLLFLPDGRFCLLDWGMTGRLTLVDREELLELILAIVNEDSRHLVDALLAMTQEHQAVNRRDLERDLLDLLDGYASLPLKDVSLGQLLLDVASVLRDHRLRLPPNLFLMIKALMAAENVGRTLYPELNVVAEAEPLIRELARRRFSRAALARRFRATVTSLLATNRRLPQMAMEIVDKLHHGDLALRFEHANLDGLRATLEETGGRLTLGIILGSMIIGSSMIVTTGVRPLLFGYPALGVIGFLIAGVLGLWLAAHIVRYRRK